MRDFLWHRIHNFLHKGFETIASIRHSSGEHLVENNSKTEQIGANIELLASDLLGRHIERSSDDHAKSEIGIGVRNSHF